MASKKNKTFADQAKTIMSKYALRPNDNASKTAMDLELKALRDEQETERQKMADQAMETLNSLGMAPPMQGAPQQMPPQQEMMGPPPQGMPMQQAYGGNMRKKYWHGGVPHDDETNLKSHTAWDDNDDWKYNDDDEYDADPPKEDPSKDLPGEVYDKKLTTGDYIAGLVGAGPDIAGLAYAAKKPSKRKRMTAKEQRLDTAPFDNALARAIMAARDISRTNPNATLSTQIASNTAMNSAVAAQKAAVQQAMDAKNIQNQMRADQINLDQDERDRQAMDARMMSLFEHGKGITDAYTGLRKDKKTMDMETAIINSMDTENYTYTWVDGKLVPTAKV